MACGLALVVGTLTVGAPVAATADTGVPALSGAQGLAEADAIAPVRFSAPRREGYVGRAMNSVLVDLDADGVLDVLEVHKHSLSVRVSSGGGDLLPTVTYTSQLTLQAVAAADLDVDGDIDVVTTSTDGTVQVWSATGSTALAGPVDIPVPGAALLVDVATGDVDGDGVPDAVVAANDPTRVWLLAADGTGGLSEPQLLASVGRGSTLPSLVVADLDQDATAEVITVGLNPAGLSVLGLQDGLPTRRDYDLGAPQTELAVGDLNGDGFPEVAAVKGDRPLSVLPNDGSGVLGPVVTYSSGGGNTEVVIADANGDGLSDVTISRNQAVGTKKPIVVLRGDGSGTLAPYVVVPGTENEIILGLADWNGDGRNDLITRYLSLFVRFDVRLGDNWITVDVAPVRPRLTPGGDTLYFYRDGNLAAAATVRYATRDLTATAPSDYRRTTETVTFAPGVRQVNVDGVLIRPATSAEPVEYFAIDLLDPVGTSLLMPFAIATILESAPR